MNHAQQVGGVNQVFIDYAEILARKHELALVVSANANDSFKIKNVQKIFKLKNKSQFFDVLQVIYILWKFKPDVILCHSNRNMKWMRILKFFTKAKSIGINHGGTFRNALFCDYAISVNEQIAQCLRNAGFNKGFVVQNAIKITEKYQEKILKKPIIIASYGRIEYDKGFDILIKACGILQKNNIDFRLKIGGFEVPQSNEIIAINDLAKLQKIYSKYKFVGLVKDKKEFFKDVDIFVVPSRHEAFGMVILEAFLHSTLVISSNTDGGRFLIKDGENGLLFNSGDCEDLARLLQKLLQDGKDYGRMTKNAFSKIESEFSCANLEKSLDEILQKIKC